ncbi:MAG TPA: hypothetical protein VG294_07670 [Solirubrobacteraceae bacterium]|jgi:hypothetical protein|nr:hypothetical protein [Solirubrobacteraceae bacterium]
MRRTPLHVLVTIGLALGACGALAASASAAANPTAITIFSSVGPVTLQLSDLSAMPQTSETIGSHVFTGVLLYSLLNSEFNLNTATSPLYPQATPTLGAPKNPDLHVIVTVASGLPGPMSGPVSFAFGEFEPNYGNNAALLALSEDGSPLSNGAELVLPRDVNTARFVAPVTQLDVTYVIPPAVAQPPTGGLNVDFNGTTTVFTAAQLASLRQTTFQVNFATFQGSQTLATETGPTVAEILDAAGITPDLTTWVGAVNSNQTPPPAYVAGVSPGEATSGDRPLILSINELMCTTNTQNCTQAPTTNTPRIVPVGDISGPRWSFGITDFAVVEGTTTAITPTNLSAPTISGTTTQGLTLTLAHGSWFNFPTTYNDQWLRCSVAGANCQAIGGATGQTYTLTAADIGSTIAVQETGLNATGTVPPLVTSAVTAVVAAAPVPYVLAPKGIATVGTATVKGHTASERVTCAGPATTTCLVHGTLTTKHGGRTVTLGQGTVTVAGGHSGTLHVSLRKPLKRGTKLAATLTTTQGKATLSSQVVDFSGGKKPKKSK